MSNYGLFSDLSGVWIVLAHKTDHVCGNSLQIVLADYHGGNAYLADTYITGQECSRTRWSCQVV